MEKSKNPVDHEIQLTGDWAQQSDQIQQKYPELSRADLQWERSEEQEEMLERVQKKLSRTRDEVIAIIKEVQPPKP